MSRDAASRSGQVLVAELADVLHWLDAQPLSDETVHAARKAIKKARAALRLLRATLTQDIYLAENVALRDAGRYFAPLRDAKSLLAAFETLRERHPEDLQHAAYQSLSEHLRAKLLEQHRELLRTPEALENCMHLVSRSLDRASRWKDGALPAEGIAPGLQRIFRAGRKALAHARRTGTPEALHEWRKHVKYLSNALKVLGFSGAGSKKLVERADKLAAQLGEDHDLCELQRPVSSGEFSMGTDASHTLVRLIEFRRAKLQRRAYALGAKIYDEKPGHFSRRMDRKEKRDRNGTP